MANVLMWARRAAGVVGVLALAACATRAPVRPQIASRLPITAPPSTTAVAAPTRIAPTRIAPIQPSAPPAAPAPAVPHYANLFSRIRAGFQLPDPDKRVIAQEAHWYANHPKFLQRAFGRADMYLYYIVTQLQSRRMPLELSLLPIIESAFRPYAYSWARAAGIWQFTSGTGKLFGLKQDWWYDGRLNVIASTKAALNYLQQLHDQLGDNWLLAIAAYNCGVVTVQRAIRINRAEGRPTDFWHLRLPRQTEYYVPQLLAMARLVADPGKYGLSFSPIPDQPYFARVATDGQINLEVAAELAGITSDEIYQLNPAFHRWATDPTGPFYLLLPVDAAPVFEENVASLTPDERMGVERYVVRRGDSLYSVAQRFKTTAAILHRLNTLPHGRLVVGQSIEVPASVYHLPHSVLLADARIDHFYWRGRFRFRVVRVHSGDTLWGIARRNGMSVRRLAQINGLSQRDVLRPGERLRLYADARAGGFRAPRFWVHSVRVRPGDTLWSIARRHHMSVYALASLNGLHSGQIIRPGEQLRLTADVRARTRAVAAPRSDGNVVRVRPGDTLWSIARRHHMSVHALASLNDLRSNQILRPGERLRLNAGVSAARSLLAGVGRSVDRSVRRVIYTVRAGDTLWQIAQHFQVKVAQIVAWNEMNARRPILAGEKLMILADSGG